MQTFATKHTQRSPQAMQLRPAEAGGFKLPRSVKPKKAHHFIHRPEGWRLEPGHGFVPTLGETAAVPGVNGARRAHGDHALSGPVDMSGPVQVLARQGCTYIDPNDNRLGEYQGYDTYYHEVEGGERHHIMSWERCTVLPTGRVVWDREAGAAGLLKFRLHLRDSGMVQPISDEVIVGMLDAKRNRRSGILSRAGAAADTEYIKAKIAKIDAEIEAIEAAWSELRSEGVEVQAPAPRKGRSNAKASGGAGA